jgi:hypothetical protein
MALEDANALPARARRGCAIRRALDVECERQIGEPPDSGDLALCIDTAGHPEHPAQAGRDRVAEAQVRPIAAQSCAHVLAAANPREPMPYPRSVI